jgi:hypothetical protein
MGPVAANLRLHGQSRLALLFALLPVCFLVGAVTGGSGRMALASVLFFAYSAAALYREVELCDFVRVLPAHRGMARRLLFGVALTTGVVAGFVQRDVAFLAFAAGGAGVALLVAVVTMWHPGSFWVIWMVGLNAVELVRDMGWPSESALTATIVVASAVWMLVAWRLLDQAVIDRWVSRRPQRIFFATGSDAQRRVADAIAARRESGSTIATLIIQVLASRRTTPGMRTMAALILPNGGAISVKLGVGLALLAVAVGGVGSVLLWFGGMPSLWFLFILPSVPLMLIQAARVTRTLPIDRRRLLWAHLRFIAYSVLACIATLLVMDAIGHVTSRILLRLGVSHTAPGDFWKVWPAYVLPVLVVSAAAPLHRVTVGGFSALFLASIPLGFVLNAYGVTVACLGTAAAGALAYAALRWHYLRGDLT